MEPFEVGAPKGNYDTLTINILHGICGACIDMPERYEEVKAYFFRLKDLRFSDLEAEKHALTWAYILRFLDGPDKILDFAGSQFKNIKPEYGDWTTEVKEDLLLFIRKRHENWIRRET